MARRDTAAGSVTVNPAARAILGNLPTSVAQLNKGRIVTRVEGVTEDNRLGAGRRVMPTLNVPAGDLTKFRSVNK